MAQLVMTVVAALVALIYGAIALVGPHRVQQWWFSDPLRKKVAMKIYGEEIKSSTYILHLRILGLIAVLLSILLFYFAFVGNQ